MPDTMVVSCFHRATNNARRQLLPIAIAKYLCLHFVIKIHVRQS